MCKDDPIHPIFTHQTFFQQNFLLLQLCDISVVIVTQLSPHNVYSIQNGGSSIHINTESVMILLFDSS